MNPVLSIIIPTHKRAKILGQFLEHIERQTIKDQLEVIVVSDGRDDETAELFKKMKNDTSLRNFHYFDIPKSHQGVARNRGVEKAQGKYVMFIGDDIFLDPHACQKHVAAHETRNSKLETNSKISHSNLPIVSEFEFCTSKAVLGFTTWDPAVGITPVMTWLEKSGWQFGYPMIAPYAHLPIPPSLQHRFTYTSNISLPTDIAKQFPFREDVTLYGWEDMEWGWRLTNAGIALFYEPDARALHHHHITLDDSLKRMETLGKSAVKMEKISAAFLAARVVPRGWKKLKYQIASLLPTMRGKHAKAFLRGCTSVTAS